MKDTRSQPALTEPDSSGIPEGQASRPVFGRSAKAQDSVARFNGLAATALARTEVIAKVIEKRPLKRSRARYAPHSRSFAPFTPLVLLLMFSLLGCSGITHSSIVSNNNQRSDTANNTNTSASTMEESKTLAGGSTDPRLVTANTTFGFKLFHEVAKAGAGKNVFISPSSVALCLAMTYNGAVGETKQGMERALETRGLTHAELNRAYSQLRTELENPDPKVQLQIANSLWARKGVSFN